MQEKNKKLKILAAISLMTGGLLNIIGTAYIHFTRWPSFGSSPNLPYINIGIILLIIGTIILNLTLTHKKLGVLAAISLIVGGLLIIMLITGIYFYRGSISINFDPNIPYGIIGIILLIIGIILLIFTLIHKPTNNNLSK